MSESAEALSANQESRRNITIEITNLTRDYCLINPKVYLDSGSTHSPPQPTVRPLKTEVCNFSKNAARASGAVGVLTYDLFHRHAKCAKESVAIMFSVPHDYNLYQNWFALGIYPKNTECDKKLYGEMYYDKDSKSFKRMQANGSGLTFEGEYLDVKATMTPMGRAILKMEVWDKLFSPAKYQGYR